jgi:hypothetical protein
MNEFAVMLPLMGIDERSFTMGFSSFPDFF